jgi:very-short-patch-repair endonuclease
MAPDRVQQLTRQLMALATTQHGVFTRRQAGEIGFTPNETDRRVRTGSWASVDHGVYCIGGMPGSWKQRVMAACLAGPAVASHRSAAVLWDAPRVFEEHVEVTAVRHLRRHADDVIWHESRFLEERDVTAVDGIPVTRPTRCIVDLGSVLAIEPLLVVYDDFSRRGLIGHEGARRLLERLGPTRIGHETVRTMLDLRVPHEPVPQSFLESRFDELARAAGLSKPVRQHNVFDRDGRLIGRLDYAFTRERIGIELDGLRHHDREADEVRDLRMTDVGWHILRVSSRTLERHPELVIAGVARAVRERRI